MEIIQERLAREFNLDLIATAPSVVYRIAQATTVHRYRELYNPADMPDVDEGRERIRRAMDQARRSCTPDDYIGGILQLCQDRRGIQVELSYVGNRAMADLPTCR